jgi:hypothetical protein
LYQLQRRYAEGSHATKVARNKILALSANQLHEMGYRNMQSSSLKPKHVHALVQSWQETGLSAGTIKNRMAHIRWWAEKIGKHNVVMKNNAEYGISKRRYVTNTDKSQRLDGRAARIADTHVKYSLRLQELFGLRREEAIKFSPSYADQGDRIVLKSTWTKGGKSREIPVRTPEQRTLLNEIKGFVRHGSLIPHDKRYVDQLRKYENSLSNAGLCKMHGLRHHYAQQRYEELTGWKAPTAGGPSARYMARDKFEKDREARLKISSEMGHDRLSVVAIYLGS